MDLSHMQIPALPDLHIGQKITAIDTAVVNYVHSLNSHNLSTIGGIFLGCCAALCSSGANVILKILNSEEGGGDDSADSSNMKLNHQWLWFLCIPLYVGMTCCDLLALSLAPLSLIAPTSSLNIVFNVYLAKTFFQEHLSMRDVVATFFIVGGSACAVLVGSTQEANRSLDDLMRIFTSERFVAFFILTNLTATLCFYVFHSTAMRPMRYADVASLRSSSNGNVGGDRDGSDGKNTKARESLLTGGTSTEDEFESDSELSDIEKQDVSDVEEDGETEATERLTVSLDGGKGMGGQKGSLTQASSKIGNILNGKYGAGSGSDKSGMLGHGHGKRSRRHRIGSKQIDIEDSVMDAVGNALDGHPANNRTYVKALAGSITTSFLAGWTNLLGKCTVEMVKKTIHGSNQFMDAKAWLILFLCITYAVLQLKLMARLMGCYESVFIVPIFQCVYLFTMILYGGIIFKEFEDFNVHEAGIFFASLFVCVMGIQALAQRKTIAGGLPPAK